MGRIASRELWVVTDRADTIVRVDPRGPTVSQTWQLDTQPHNGAFVDGSFWTAAFDEARLLRLRLD